MAPESAAIIASMEIRVSHLPSSADLSANFAIREAVFQKEDGIPRSEDIDGNDSAAEQFLAYAGDTPVGTARYRLKDGGYPKIERVAVLPGYRGAGVGTAIMHKI